MSTEVNVFKMLYEAWKMNGSDEREFESSCDNSLEAGMPLGKLLQW